MKKNRFLFIIILAMILSACSKENSTPTPKNESEIIEGIVYEKKGTVILVIDGGTKEDLEIPLQELLRENKPMIFLRLTTEQASSIERGNRVIYLAREVDQSLPASGTADFIEVVD